MAKKIKKVLPVATFVWPKLNEVDVYQPVDKKGRPSGAEKRRFVVNLKFNDDDHRAVDKWLDEVMADAGVEDGKKPWRKDKKTGEMTLVATSGEQYRPTVYDAAKQEIPVTTKIGGGTKGKVFVTVNPYTGFGGGINLYINFVQIIDLKVAKKFQVEAEEGFTYDGSDDADEAEGDVGAPEAPSTTEDDDIPF